MFPFSPQPLTLGNTPLGYSSNIQNQLFFQQPGLAQPDFPPLPSPHLPQQNPIPPQPPSRQALNPLVNPPNRQHDASHPLTRKYDSDVDLYTDTSDVENGTENTKDTKGTSNEHKRGWQHVKKRKRVHQSTEPSTRLHPEISTQNRFSLLHNRQENKESPQPSTHNNTPNTPRPPPILVYRVTNFKAMLDDLADVAEPHTYHTTALANDIIKISANTIDTYRNLVKHNERRKYRSTRIKVSKPSHTYVATQIQCSMCQGSQTFQMGPVSKDVC